MGVFRQFPYSNFHEMNMDEIIKIIKNMLEEWATYHAQWDQWMADLEASWTEYQGDMNAQWTAYQNTMNTAWQSMQDFINNYFDNLDVQDEINNKIVSMIQTGEFGLLVNEYIPPAVNAWLNLNITEPEGVVIDTSLTVSGACADAKATGDAIANVNSDNEYLKNNMNTYLVKSNVLLTRVSFTVGDTGGTYEQASFYTLYKTFTENEAYSFACDSIVGNTTNALRIHLKHGSTVIRTASAATIASTHVQVIITAEDITNEVNNIEFFVYASTSEAQTEPCVLTNPTVYEGLIMDEIISYTNNFAEETVKNSKILGNFDLGTLNDGFVNSETGRIFSADSYKVTDYIDIKSKKIEVKITAPASKVGMAFYNSAKQYISGVDFSEYEIGDIVAVDVPEYTAYFVYCAVNAQASNMMVRIPKYSDAISMNWHNPCKWSDSEECRTFKNILCIGDSLTEGALDYTENGNTLQFFDPDISYPAYLKNITGRNITNAGDSGESTVSWYTLHGSDDLSGHDACVIALGRNDYVGGTIIPSVDRITAMNNIIAKVKTDNPQIKIFICTQFNYYTELFPEWSEQVNEDMRSIVEDNTDCYLIDLAIYADFHRRYDSYSHLTAVGYNKLAEMIFNAISYIMHMNYADFKNVQFIGTNRSYT